MRVVIDLIISFALFWIGGFMIGSIVGPQWLHKLYGLMMRVRYPTTFQVQCPICEHDQEFQKKHVRQQLEANTPIAICEQCQASLVSLYFEHAYVIRARIQYTTLIERNKLARTELQEPHHPLRSEENELIANSIVLYHNSGNKV